MRIDTEKLTTSLAALGVTLLAAGPVRAGEVTVLTDVTDVNGVTSPSFTLGLPGTNTFTIQAMHSTKRGKAARFISMTAVGTYGKVKAALNGRWNVLVSAPAGQTWAMGAGNLSIGGTLAGNTSLRGSAAFASHYTDAFFNFVFKDTTRSKQLEYGWVELSLVHDGFNTQDVQIVAYAWEPDGAALAAGAAPSDVVPEPATGPVGAAVLGAMVLGAAGVRRWKAGRQNQAA